MKTRPMLFGLGFNFYSGEKEVLQETHYTFHSPAAPNESRGAAERERKDEKRIILAAASRFIWPREGRAWRRRSAGDRHEAAAGRRRHTEAPLPSR